jgi:diacylglycerol diphosphate phosphatase/phosphatidate phosphatase
MSRFFSRFSRRQADNAGSDAPRRDRHHETKRSLVMNMATRPSFGQWLKVTWLDLVTMVIMGIIGLGVSTDLEPLHPSLCLTTPGL